MNLTGIFGGKMKAYFLGDAAGIGVASAAVTSSYWAAYVKPAFEALSSEAVMATPILAAFYLCLQIYDRLFRRIKTED